MNILASASRFYAVLLSLALAWVYFQKRLNWMLLLRPGSRHLFLGILLGVGAALLIVALSHYADRNFLWAQSLEQEFKRILVPLQAWRIIVLALMSGLVEEFFFRGALQPVIGIIPASLLFGVAHFVPKRIFLPWSIYAAFAGFVMGSLVEITQDLLPAMLAHVIINFVLILNLNRRHRLQPANSAV